MKENNSRKGAYITILVLSIISILVAFTSEPSKNSSSSTQSYSTIESQDEQYIDISEVYF